MRLLTLTGTGGCGKTRLALQTAIELAPEFADGVYWCDLTALSDPALLPQTVARVLGRAESSRRSALESVIEFIARRQLLLVLDNCEQVLEACASLASAVLATCPHASILATSIQPLGLLQETIWTVPPLSLPTKDSLAQDALSQSDAVQLFVERAAHALPTFELTPQNAATIVAICRRLDGLPLAVELAAARVRMLTVEQIAQRLENAFALLTRGQFDTLPRHETLRATMEWTYQFLSDKEQTLLSRLSVFAGPFTLGMAEQVCGDDEGLRSASRDEHDSAPSVGRSASVLVESVVIPGESNVRREAVLDLLSELVEKSFVSLLPRDGEAKARYRLLEVIRQYAREELEDLGESLTRRDRYLDWCVTWAEQAGPLLTRPAPGVWTRQFELQLEHFRASLRWACTGRRVEQGLRLANALGRFWMTGGMVEGEAWLEELLQLESNLPEARFSEASGTTRAWALFWSGRLAVSLGNDGRATRRGEAALALFRAAGDTAGILNALNVLALAAQDTNHYAGALAFYDEALTLSRQLNDLRMTSVLLINQGLMYYEQQDFRRAAPLWEEAFAIAQRLDDYALWMLDDLACLAMMQGDYVRARTLLERDVQMGQESGNKLAVALALMDLGDTLRRQGDLDEAQTLLGQALAMHQQMNNPPRIGETLVNLANLERNRGELSSAKRFYEQSLPYLEQSSYTRYLSQVKMNLGVLEVLQGRDSDALPFFYESLRIAQKGNHLLCRVEALEEVAGVWPRQGQAHAAARLIALAAVERERIRAPIPPIERARYQQTLDALRAALGDDTFAAIQSGARTLRLESFVAQILGTEPKTPVPALTAEPALKCFALGPSRVLVGERALTPADWKYTKSKELFFYLLSNPPATKAQIGLDLWQDASPAQLRNIFHRALHYLRKALAHPEWIIFEDDAYSFDRGISYWCDLHEFEARLKEGQSLYKSGLPPPATRPHAIEGLEAVARLWRGDFLEDMDVGDWAIFRRESLRQAFLQGLLDLAQLYLADARYADAVTALQRAVSLDNYLEVAHRELMRAFARQGDAARALRHFNELRRLMREELGAEPSPETRLLNERLRRGDDV